MVKGFLKHNINFWSAPDGDPEQCGLPLRSPLLLHVLAYRSWILARAAAPISPCHPSAVCQRIKFMGPWATQCTASLSSQPVPGVPAFYITKRPPPPVEPSGSQVEMLLQVSRGPVIMILDPALSLGHSSRSLSVPFPCIRRLRR